MIQAGGAGRKHAIRLLSHLNDPVCIGARGGKMKMRHLGNRVANGFVNQSFGRLAAVDVGDGDVRDHRRLAGHQDFEPIAEHGKNVRPQGVEGFRHSAEPQAHGMGNAGRRIVGQIHIDAGSDIEPVAFDHRQCIAEPLLQVHSGDHKLKLQARVIHDIAQKPIKQAVLGSRTGYDADFSLSAHVYVSPCRQTGYPATSQGLEGIFTIWSAASRATCRSPARGAAR